MTPVNSTANRKSQLAKARAIRGAAFTREMEQRERRKRIPAKAWIGKWPPACCPKLVQRALTTTNAEALAQSTPQNEVAANPPSVIPERTGPRQNKPRSRDAKIEAELKAHFKRKNLGEKVTSTKCAEQLAKANLKKGTHLLDRQTRLLAHFNEEQQREEQQLEALSQLFSEMTLD